MINGYMGLITVFFLLPGLVYGKVKYKVFFVAMAIIATLIHSNGTSKMAKGLGGAVGLLATLLAAYCGVLLAHVG